MVKKNKIQIKVLLVEKLRIFEFVDSVITGLDMMADLCPKIQTFVQKTSVLAKISERVLRKGLANQKSCASIDLIMNDALNFCDQFNKKWDSTTQQVMDDTIDPSEQEEIEGALEEIFSAGLEIQSALEAQTFKKSKKEKKKK